jgi:hypothetical protein
MFYALKLIAAIAAGGPVGRTQKAWRWCAASAAAGCIIHRLAGHPQSSVAMAAGGEREAQDIARLARGLVAAYERSGRAFSLAGATAAGGKARDWRLRAVMADDSFFSNASDWSFGGPGVVKGCRHS